MSTMGCSVRWGYHDACGGYHEYRGGVQYCGGYPEYCGVMVPLKWRN